LGGATEEGRLEGWMENSVKKISMKHSIIAEWGLRREPLPIYPCENLFGKLILNTKEVFFKLTSLKESLNFI